MNQDVLSAIRGRIGVEDNDTDTSKDATINRMPAGVKFRKVCGWHLGDESWSDTIFYWLKECGYDIKEPKPPEI